MKHTCSYLQWNLSIDWNPVSIKYQIHKTIIKICTTLHLEEKKKGLNDLSIFWTHLEPGFKNLLMKETFMNKTGKGQRENWQTKVWEIGQRHYQPAPLASLHAERLVVYFHISGSQGNRTSRIRNTKAIWKTLNLTQWKPWLKPQRKLRYQATKAIHSW